MRNWKRLILGFTVFLVLLTGSAAFLLPVIVKKQAIKQVEVATGRKLTIGGISFNPFTWTAGLEKVRLTEKGKDATFVSFSSARISFSPRSIFKAAPVISEFRLVSPYIYLERTAANSYNFSDLLEGKKQPGKTEEPGKGLQFSVNNITITGGAVDFRDRALPLEKSHTLRRITITLPFISNMPYVAGRYIVPSFSAVVNGSPLRADGKLKVFPHIAEASASVNLKDLSLPFYLAYVPVKLPVAIRSGSLSTSVEITYRIAAKGKPEVEVSGTVGLADVALHEKTGNPLLALKRCDVTVRKARLLANEYDIASLTVEGPDAYLSRDRKGIWSFTRLTRGGAKEGGATQEGPPGKILVNVATIRMRAGVFHFADQLPPQGFATTVSDIGFDMDGYSNAGSKKARFTVSCATERKETLAVKGELSSVPLSLSATLDAAGIPLDAYYPYLATQLTAPIKGRLDLSGGIGFEETGGVVLDKGALKLSNITVPFAKGEGARVSSLTVDGISFHSADNRLAVEKVAFQGGDIRFSRDSEGKLSPLKLLKGGSAGKTAQEPAKRAQKPLGYLIRSVVGERINLAFTDGMVGEQPRFALKKANISLADIKGPKTGPIPFRFSTVYGNSGQIKASGRLTPEPLAVRGDITLKRIPLTDFDAYLPDNVNVVIADGALDATVRVNLSRRKNEMIGDFKGELGVRSFYCLDAEDDDLLKWESLQLDTVSGSLKPFSLSIADVALNNFFSKIVVNKDGTLNLQQLVSHEEGTKEEVKGSSPDPPQAAPVAVSGERSVKIGTVTMQDGVLAFTDNHLPRTFSTTFYNLGGRISGLTSDADRFADVDLRGNLENHSPLQITGKINPLRDDLFVDLKVRFSDIELSPLTPYSGTYLGYAVDKGKLFLDLTYHIEKKKLESSNKVFFDQFTFGRKVESEKATNLPVRLAVALLKDRKGEIHLDLPVTGRTDDPKFSVWGVVLQMLKNLLVKAATSPFTLLQSVFGGKEDFSTVNFAYGSDAIIPVEREKLAKLSAVLKDRPALKIEVSGYVDRERDGEGYRNELLLKKMKTEKFLELVKEKKNQPGDTPDSMIISTEEYGRYLKLVYKKEKFPKPRTIIGTVKDLPNEEMKKLILANTAVGEKELQGLAAERATAVRNYLIDEGKLNAARIFKKSQDIYKAPTKEGQIASRAEFGVTID